MAATPVKYVTIGTLVNGKPAIVRSELATSGALQLAHMLILLITGFDMAARMIQAKGTSPLSANTHFDGAGIDYRVWGMNKAARWVVVAIFRECGFSASWARDWAGNYHLHVGADLGTTWTYLAYQVAAVRAGFDGLGKGGRGGRDTHPDPTAWRTVWQGAAWAQTQLIQQGKPGLPSTGNGPTPTQPEEDTLSAAEADRVIAELKAYTDLKFRDLQAKGFDRGPAQFIAKEVWDQSFVYRGADKKQVTTKQELADAKSLATQAVALAAAQADAKVQAATGEPIDYDRISKVVAAAVNRLTVTTTIGGKS